MTIQSSDAWNHIHYALAEYYETRTGENAALITEAACVAWNAISRRRSDSRRSQRPILATIQFRGVPCQLVEDYSHIWGRTFEHEESRILAHFESLLGEWAATNNLTTLDKALDRFAVRNRTSLMWTVFMEAGAEHPSSLGVLLEDVLNEPLFLTHPDYAFGGAALLGSLHRAGNRAQRERVEKLSSNCLRLFDRGRERALSRSNGEYRMLRIGCLVSWRTEILCCTPCGSLEMLATNPSRFLQIADQKARRLPHASFRTRR